MPHASLYTSLVFLKNSQCLHNSTNFHNSNKTKIGTMQECLGYFTHFFHIKELNHSLYIYKWLNLSLHKTKHNSHKQRTLVITPIPGEVQRLWPDS